MAIRQSTAIWEGPLKEGRGTINIGSEGLQVRYGFESRFEGKGPGTNPEELIGAAHAGCFSMALANELAKAGHPPVRIETVARVHLTKGADGFSIPTIELETSADVAGIDSGTFERVAETAKRNCPVSKVLAGATITLTARLLSAQQA